MKRDTLAAALVTAALAGCAASAPMPATLAAVAPAWSSPLPHGGTLAELNRWWEQFDDPLLARLVAAAEGVSPSIASAGARLAEARATRTGATAALLPSLDATANVGRGRQDVSLPLGTSEGIGLQASWELDVFGRNRAARDAAGARLSGAEASWHDARVVVAAETANQYVGLRACEARLAQARLDADSRAETARLTGLSMQSGFESRANAALTRASAAQGLVNARQQGEQCDQDVKALVALTGIAEPELRAQLASAGARLPEPAAIVVPSVPAAALAQRPDVFARER
ncbi:MAG TPA: TolC family protein, partial [Caldimonas sp.]